jgi:hypothetical protein
MNSEIELRDHVFVGPLRRSVNNARHIPGSIHDDATATVPPRKPPGTVSAAPAERRT